MEFKDSKNDDHLDAETRQGKASAKFDDISQYTKGVIPETDDPTATQFSFRVVVLGLFWCTILSCANMMFSFRTNSFQVDATVAILMSYPLGHLLARVLPPGILNPGPFSGLYLC